MKQRNLLSVLVIIMLFYLPWKVVNAQTALNIDGMTYEFGYDKDAKYRDYIIPSDFDPTISYNQITFSFRGGDGGRRRVAGICTEPGGNGAKVMASFAIGTETGELKPGGTIRFIVGQEGGSNKSNGLSGAGGGGGTAVLYKAPDYVGGSDCQESHIAYELGGDYYELSGPEAGIGWDESCWIILAVAGGGGGAYAAGGCAESSSGKPGNAGESGKNGKGDTGGEGGNDGRLGKTGDGGGGGGGYKIRGRSDNAKGWPGMITGKQGGNNNTWLVGGGYGFGSGGSGARSVYWVSGGGGGGFSGGGGGGQYNGGGGGGSFVNPNAITGNKKDGNGTDRTPNNGKITYRFETNPGLVDAPVAQCQDVTILVSGNDVQLEPDDADDNSYDPNNRDLTLLICDSDNICSPAWGFDCADIGKTYSYVLQVSNGSVTSTCDFTVEVEQGQAGTLTCPDPVSVELFDCESIVESNREYGGVPVVFEPQTFPACNTNLDYYIIRPDNTLDTFPLLAFSDEGIRSDTFDVGTSTVFYIAHYEDGEAVEQVQTCSFTVTVEPYEFSLNCPPDVRINVPNDDYDPESPCSITVEDDHRADHSANLGLNYGGCGDISYQITGPGSNPTITEGMGELTSFDFENGVSTVEYTLVRKPGEVFSCSFTVEIDQRDFSPEFTTCPTGPTLNIDVFDGITEQQILDQIDFEITDNCGIVQYELSGFDPSCDEIGNLQRDVRITAYDGSGRSDACTFDVRTQAQTQIGVICREDLIVQLEPGNCSASVTADLLTPAGIECGKNFTYILTQSNQVIDSGNGLIPSQVLDAGTYEAAYKWTENIGGLDYLKQCIFTIEVRESVAPTAVCQDLTVNLGAIPLDVAAQVGAGSTDNCSQNLTYELGLELNCENTGLHVAILTVTDESGNAAYCSALINVIDDVSPTPKCKSSVTVNLDAQGQGQLSTTEVDDGSTDNCAIADLSFGINALGTILYYDCSDIGDNMVTLTMSDNSGNTSTCNATVTVEDNIAPNAECQNVSVQLDVNGDGSTAASVVDNGSSDACGIADISLDQTSFNCSHVGDNTVILTVTDNNGNTSACNATVTVEDNIAPAAVCQNVTVQLDANGDGSTSAAAVDNGSGDACGIADVSLDQISFDCSDVGDNTVTLTVTDNNDNTSTCNATITVEDNIAPNAECRNVTVQLDASGNSATTATAIDNGSSDACGITDLSLDQTSFDCTHVGDNTVTLTVTDSNGNTSTCFTTVVVEDNVAPTAVCQDVSVQIDESGSGSISSAVVDNGSEDACGIASSSLSQTDFYCSDIGTNSVVLTVTDANGNVNTCTATVTVLAPQSAGSEGWQLAPGLKIWPPDYTYQTLTIDDMVVEIIDACGQLVSPDDVWIDQASSDEAEDAPGTYDGNTLNDIVISEDCKTIQVRKERNTYGNGRVYAITLAYADASGAISYADYEVSAARWPWGWYSNAVKDAAIYTVECGAESGAAIVVENGTSYPSADLSRGNSPVEGIELSAYPNPFQSTLNIRFNLAEAGYAALEVFDLQGRRLKQLLSEELYAGQHEVRWDGTDNGRQNLSSGMYFIRLTMGDEVLMQKVLLQRE